MYYIHDDAQQLEHLASEAFDVVVSNFALMDIPNLAATYAAISRVLRPGGQFIFAITHPCFCPPDSSNDAREGDEAPMLRYHREGFWCPDGRLIGQVGAYHRTLATYLTTLTAQRFCIQRLLEPPQAPYVLAVAACREQAES